MLHFRSTATALCFLSVCPHSWVMLIWFCAFQNKVLRLQRFNLHHRKWKEKTSQCDLGSVGEDHHFNKWLIKYVLPMLRAWLPLCVCLFVPFLFEFPWVWVSPNAEQPLQFPATLSCSDPERLFAGLSVYQCLSILDRFNCLSVNQSL